MDNQSFDSWPAFEVVAKEEEPIWLTDQQPLDFNGYPLCNWQGEVPIMEDTFGAVPLNESFVTGPLNSSMDLLPDHLMQDDWYNTYDREWGVLDGLTEQEANKSFEFCNREMGEEVKERKIERCKEDKILSFSELSRCFYMPITQAAKELNVGLTPLKKRCRELGIPRWPHRKMKSLQTLIKNVQELGREDGEVGEAQLRSAIEVLEQQRRMMEKMPAMQIGEQTKKLRQACFKANYKKKKLSGMVNLQPTAFSCIQNHEQMQ